MDLRRDCFSIAASMGLDVCVSDSQLSVFDDLGNQVASGDEENVWKVLVRLKVAEEANRMSGPSDA